MSERLLESDLITTNLQALFSGELSNDPPEDAAGAADELPTGDAKATSDKVIPKKYNWGWWRAELSRRLTENSKKDSANRKSDEEIELEFFKDFFQMNWVEASASKLIAIGEPLRRVIKVLGFDQEDKSGGNPILAFMRQGYVQKYLLQPGFLNASTFRAIYNTIPERLIAHSEFFAKNDYNILYCKDLYTKSPKEMLEYFRLQSRTLSPSAEQYDQNKLNENKITFLQSTIKSVTDELNTVKRANVIKATVKTGGIKALQLGGIGESKLNSLELVKELLVNTSVEKVHLDAAGQNKIIEAIKSDYARIYATLLAICISTRGTKARKALTNGLLAHLDAAKIAEATEWLAANKIIVKGELRGEDADALVDKINTVLSERGQQR